MAETPILKQLRTFSEREIAQMHTDAEAEAVRITESADREAEEMVESVKEQVHAETDRIRERQLNLIRFAHNARRYELKSQALGDVWREAESLVKEYERSERYPALIAALFRECADQVPADATVHVAPTDAETVRSLIADEDRSFAVVEDPSVHGGLKFHWPEGDTVLINTLPYRLARLKAEGNAEVSRALFGAGEEDVP